MYVLSLHIENAKKNQNSLFRIEKNYRRIRKWTLLSSNPVNRELLQLTALVCCGHPFVPHLPFDPLSLFRDRTSALRIGVLFGLHAPFDCISTAAPIAGSILQIDPKGVVIDNRGKQDERLLPTNTPRYRLRTGTGNTKFFSLAYGPELQSHVGTDDFDFNDPCFRANRLSPLFDPNAAVTDPAEFLTRLHYKAIRCGRFPAKQTLQSLCSLFAQHLWIDTGRWEEKSCDFHRIWQGLKPWQQRAALPALDAARHLMDAFSKSATPLQMAGVILIDRPSRYCSNQRFPSWINLMDRLLPEMQFLITLPGRYLELFPNNVRRRRLSLPEAAASPKAKRKSRVRRETILLLDVDSRLPNLALMKLSRHFKLQGRRVQLMRKDEFVEGAEVVYASCVFSTPASKRRVGKLRDYYGDSLVLGGSGVDLKRRLSPEIEGLEADYGLYRELGNRAIGFITRGCPYRCSFCLVPKKEGNVRRVSDLDTLLQGRKKLILLDDNLLAHPEAGDILEEMAQRALQVNFTQTLDIRLLDREQASILKRIHCSNTRFTRRTYHFSLNRPSGLARIEKNYRLFEFGPSDNVEFVCMYGFDTTLEEDVERFRFLHSLPGAYVFVQEYQPVLDGIPPRTVDFFNGDPDRLIDQLITIEYRQNMKSMEKYYRWLSKRYVQHFGRLHSGLVDTIFRYNDRDRKGRYIATLAGTLSMETAVPKSSQ
jgi:hypothetical protein